MRRIAEMTRLAEQLTGSIRLGLSRLAETNGGTSRLSQVCCP
jgi:hypothetical protein